MYTDNSKLKGPAEVINHGVYLGKEAVTIDQQKKQFQHTDLHTMELMNEMFSL